MIISEVMHELNQIKEKEGDIYVYVHEGSWDCEEVVEVDCFNVEEEKYFKDGKLRYPKRVTLE